eukprot:scaffold419407_cov47-Prasinocladus_malaysianus.AAC.1
MMAMLLRGFSAAPSPAVIDSGDDVSLPWTYRTRYGTWRLRVVEDTFKKIATLQVALRVTSVRVYVRVRQ